ncbi:MAG: DUF1844 domain-containing protein [bacterium JZ-2024 1]
MTPEIESPESERSKQMQEPVAIADILLTTFTVLHEKAFAYLGLLVHGETGEVRENLEEAKLAIEAMNALLPLIKPRLTESQRMEVTLAVTNAQLNFARKVGSSGGEGASSSPQNPERDVS